MILRLLTLQLIAAHPLEAIFRLNNIPFGVLNAIFGTSQSPFGGFSLPVDSRAVALLAHPPFLTSGNEPPATSSRCNALFKRREGLTARAAAKLANQASAPDDPWISLIEAPEELADVEPEDLNCLFYLGYPPKTIPHGLAYGRVYHVLGNTLINDVAQISWGGKVFMQVQCDDPNKVVHMCTNYANRSPAAWAHIYISNNPLKETMGLYPGDWIDDDASLWVDYGADFQNLCPNGIPRFYDSAPGIASGVPGSRNRWGAFAHTSWGQEIWKQLTEDRHFLPNLVGGPGALFTPGQVNLGMFNNGWPLREVVDSLRWVGRDETYGTDIYLGRSYYAFPEGLRTVALFSLKFRDLQNVTVIHPPR